MRAIVTIIMLTLLSGCVNYNQPLYDDGQGLYYDDGGIVYSVSSSSSFGSFAAYPWWSMDYFYLGFHRTGDGRTHTTARTSTRITSQSCIHPGTGIHTIGTADITLGVIRTGTIGTGTISTLLQQTPLIRAETIGALLWRRPAGRAG